MSEYQYYEWQAIDRRLSAEEQEDVEALSSHMEVSATDAWVEYQWSNFKHDPLAVLGDYFDAFQYYANWGMQQIAFRFPKDLLDANALSPYLSREDCVLFPHEEHLIFSIAMPENEYRDPPSASANLALLATLRRDIMDGDYRMPYLAWLVAVSNGGFDDDLEPPVPPGLKKLTPPLKEFVRFFDLDPFVVKAATEVSIPMQKAPAIDVNAAIAGLPREERDAFLSRLASDEPLLSVKLRRRLTEPAASEVSVQAAPSRRTWLELAQRAQQLGQEAEKRRAADAEAHRLRALEQFAANEEQTWLDVDALIQRKQAPYYDQATDLLVQLRDLAVHHDKMPEFWSRLRQLSTRYANRPALLERLHDAGLILSRSEITGKPGDERLKSDDAPSLFAAQDE